jgi:hypothetical protein
MSREPGYILLPVVLLVSLVATVAFMLNHGATLEGDITASVADSTAVRYVAEGGMQHAMRLVQDSNCAGNLTIGQTELGANSYQASATTAATSSAYTLNVDQDTWLKESAPSVNFGADSTVSAKFNPGDSMRALYRFDLATIPVGARIASATAWFFVAGNDPEGPVNVHAVTDAWTEAAANWSNTASRFDSVVVASIPPQPSSGVWVAVNITGLVQAWMNGNPNNGIMLVATSDAKESKFTSREWSTASERPRLDVVVTSGPAAPVTITATGTLTGNPTPANDITRTLTRIDVPPYQPPSFYQDQPGAARARDAYIWEWEPSFNYGTADDTWVASTPPNWNRALALFQFEVNVIPPGAKILDARLSLYHRGGGDADVPVTAHRITNGWDEGFVSWNKRKNSTNWDTAGGDIDTMVEGTTLVGPASNMRYEWDISNLVQGWVDGAYPNHGVALRTLQPSIVGERFSTSDHADPAQHPRLRVTFACECGTACLLPQGYGKVLMVVVNPTTPVPADAYKKALFESWGYTVNLIGENTNAAGFMAAAASNDVFFISETVNVGQVGVRLRDVPIGVVSEDGIYTSQLGFAENSAWPTGSAINVTDTSHYITTPFPSGPLDIYAAAMEQLTVSGPEAPGLQVLADASGAGSLVLLEQGAAMGGDVPAENAAGRRVMLPLGRALNFNYLNANGRLLVQRALQWGTGNTGGPPKNLLLVVVDPASLTAQEAAKQALIESWGYVVNLIDESDTQANFDAAIAANDVAYIPQDINSTNLGTKLRNATIGVVNEEGEQVDELGISGDKIFKTRQEIDIVDNSHYITQPFATGLLTFVSSDQSVHMLSGDIAPGLLTLARSFNVGSQWNSSLAVIETGDALDISGTAAGRRMQLPWGGGTFDINQLNADGQTIMQRAIEWAEGAGSGGGASLTVLLVVGDDATLASKDAGRKALMESWGYTVTVIDDGDSQANFDAAAAANDVVYVSGTVVGGTLADKLTSSTAPIVNESNGKLDNFGFCSSTATTASDTAFSKTDPAHYITEPFSGNLVTVFTGMLTMPVPGGTLAPGLQLPGSVSDGGSGHDPALVTLKAGTTGDDGNPVPARRAHLPYASAETADLTADGETILQRALEWAAGVGDPTPSGYLDEFNAATCVAAVDYAGSDGLVDWSGWQWTEENETDGPCAGQIQIATDPLIADPGSNRLQVTGAGIRMQRQLDLSGFTSPALSFDYRLVNYPLDDFMRIRISTDGGLNWTELDRFTGPLDHSTYQSASYDISAFIDVDTLISFEFNGISSTRVAYLDNIHIQESGGGGGGPPPTCAATFADDFETDDYTGSTGTAAWAGDWTEINDSGNPGNGNVQVAASSGNRLLQMGNSVRGAQRVADLSGHTSATLELGYWRSGLDGADEYATVEVSTDGSNWTLLDQFVGPGNDPTSSPPTIVSYDISAHLSATTHIRFVTSGNNSKFDRVLFDDIEICADN